MVGLSLLGMMAVLPVTVKAIWVGWFEFSTYKSILV